MQSATLILEVALKWEAVKGVILDFGKQETLIFGSSCPNGLKEISHFMVAFRIVKGVHKTSATFCSTGKAAHKVNSSLWKRALRRTGRAVIRDHMGFIKMGMSEGLERQSAFKKHLGSFELGWQ